MRYSANHKLETKEKLLQSSSVSAKKSGFSSVGVDGLMKPEQLADAVMEALTADQFLILPHPEVKTYIQRKAADYSRWLQGMRRLQERFMMGAPLKK